MAATFTADYPGECSACGQQVKGTEVTFGAFDELVHVSCPPDPTALVRDTCPHCFLELPATGVCEECS